VGNHEYSVWLGEPLGPTPPDVHSQQAVCRHIDSGNWSLATSVNGVLVTHAGLSEEYSGRFGTCVRRDARSLAAAINADFATTVSLGVDGANEARDLSSPLWYRPHEQTPPVIGVRQVAGHTPPEILRGDEAAEQWASRGLCLIDPFVRGWVRVGKRRSPVPLRYAVVEDGEVHVVEREGANRVAFKTCLC